jgi:hypothetical protein
MLLICVLRWVNAFASYLSCFGNKFFFFFVYMCTRAIKYIDDVTSPCAELCVTTMKCIFLFIHIKCDSIRK